MPAKANLKDMRREERSALRERILDAASGIVEKHGADALSMRRLAVELGCSPMAIYHYFADKHGILLALAERNFASLAKRLARNVPDDPVEALKSMFARYARFGLDNPAEYRTMFMTPEAQPDRNAKSESEMYRENPAFALGVHRVRACIEAGAFGGDPHFITTLLWTNVHGAIAAMICLPAFPFGKPDRYIANVIDSTLRGLSK